MKKLIALVMFIFLVACARQPADLTPADGEMPDAAEEPFVEEPDAAEEPVEEVAEAPEEVMEEPDAAMEEPAVKEFNVRAFQFGYEPGTIEVNKGDTVIIRAHTSDVPHGFRIREFDVDLAITSEDSNNPDVVEFVASEEGEFSFYCSIPCGRGHKSMNGKLIVNP